jgi:XisI protein
MKRIYHTTMHFDIKDGKIWIQQNMTDVDVGQELVDLGVPKEDIILGLQPPYKRPYTGYGVAHRYYAQPHKVASHRLRVNKSLKSRLCKATNRGDAAQSQTGVIAFYLADIPFVFEQQDWALPVVFDHHGIEQLASFFQGWPTI